MAAPVHQAAGSPLIAVDVWQSDGLDSHVLLEPSHAVAVEQIALPGAGRRAGLNGKTRDPTSRHQTLFTSAVAAAPARTGRDHQTISVEVTVWASVEGYAQRHPISLRSPQSTARVYSARGCHNTKNEKNGESMATSSRRVGAETSKTRDTLLDWVEKMMLEEGYASISYRALAARAEISSSLVQYYFPSLDDIFVAAIRRYNERNLAFLTAVLKERAEDPLRALWEYSWDESTGALMTEFMALGNHRKSIQSEIAAVTENVRKIQLAALVAKFGKNARPISDLSLPALQLLISGLPKLINLEQNLGIKAAHADVTKTFERFIDEVEPPKKTRRKATSRRRASSD